MKKLFLLLLAMVTTMLISSTVFAKVYYVSVPGFPNSGSSLSYTIEAARNNAGVDTVYIGTGTYKLDAELIIEDVIIGGCSSDGSRNIIRQYPGAVNNNRTQQTVLDGNSFVRVLPSLKHRVATVNIGGILEGCVIRNGHARGTEDDPADMSGFGGGVLVNGGKVQNCIIRGNVAMNLAHSSSNPSKGGGAFITDNGGEVVNCIIVFNLDDRGLGVDGNAGSVVNNTIARNCTAPQYAFISGTDGTPYQHYKYDPDLTANLVLPYIELNDFYMATTETTMGQYACFLAAIDLASGYSASDWVSMCSAKTPMYGYTGISIAKYLGMSSDSITPHALLSTSTSDPQSLGMSGTVGSGSEVYYPLKATSAKYAAGTSGGVDYPADPLVRDNFPMGYVTWYGNLAFCAWIGGMLPTEAQWEYAARKKADGSVQVSAAYAGGQTNANSIGWNTSNASSSPHEVATLLPTELGLYDMNGNQWEWIADWHNGSNSYPTGTSVDPAATVPNGCYLSTSGGVTGGTAEQAVYNPIYSYSYVTSHRMYRGGAWSSNELAFVLGYRHDGQTTPSYLYNHQGFRSAACAGL